MQRTMIADPKAALIRARQLLASDPGQAEAQARTVLTSDPDNAEAHRLLGQALRRGNRPEEAAQAELQALEASTRNPTHRAAAQALQGGGDSAHAKALLQQLLAADPNDVLALTMLGLHWTGAGEFELAEPLLRRAVDNAPDQPSTRMALAEMLVRSKRAALALTQLDQIVGEPMTSEPIQSLRAECLSALGRLDEELAILQSLAGQPGPRAISFSLRMGHALRSLGREPEAAAVYRGLTERNPGEGTAWWSLANLKTTQFAEADIATMKRALERPDMPIHNRIRLQFALGKALENRDVAATFGHYAEGNRLRASISPYDPLMISDWVDRSIALFVPAFFAAREGQGAAQDDPIFIIGMQRSGSTLVEQILASHPAIEGTAELTDIPNIVRALGEAAGRSNQSFERHLSALSADQLEALGQSYLDSSRVHRRTDRPHFTDKMPNNWMQLGVIRLILPKARIIDVRRDPMACGFSNWKQLYAKGLDHSNALDTMGRFYADYIRLMRHFDGAQPGMVHRIIYEDLVDDLDGEVRRLLAYLGLPFDPACLDFHANDRAVHTISSGQVRKPINRDGIDHWKPYEQWLGPLKQGLGDTLTSWRD